ncbi:MAG: hypothetical protein R2828_00305 [Saprospiraceae bacterium]
MDIKELKSGVNPDTHWYYQSKKVPLLAYFEKLAQQQRKPLTIIDFGAGSGFFAYELYQAFPQYIKETLLIDTAYTEEELATTAAAPVKKLWHIPDGINDAVVIMMDVLEHLENDLAVLEDIKQKTGQNIHYFITVPAFMSVWSSHDVYLGHFRRYTLPTLTTLLDNAGASISSKYYIYGSIFPLVWLIRRIKRTNTENMEDPTASDLKPLPNPINTVLKAYNTLEMNLRKWNKLFGLTCVAEGVLKD